MASSGMDTPPWVRACGRRAPSRPAPVFKDFSPRRRHRPSGMDLLPPWVVVPNAATPPKGVQGRPAERQAVPVVDYGEGTSLLTINKLTPPAGSSAGMRFGHSEYEKGTPTLHAPHR